MSRRTPPNLQKSVYDIRRENLATLLEGPGRKVDLAVRLGVSQSRISHMLNGIRRITTDQARELEQVLGIPPGALDEDRTQPVPSPKRGALDKNLLHASLKAVALAATREGVTLAPDVMADTVTTVHDLSLQSTGGRILSLPVVQALVRAAAR